MCKEEHRDTLCIRLVYFWCLNAHGRPFIQEFCQRTHTHTHTNTHTHARTHTQCTRSVDFCCFIPYGRPFIQAMDFCLRTDISLVFAAKKEWSLLALPLQPLRRWGLRGAVCGDCCGTVSCVASDAGLCGGIWYVHVCLTCLTLSLSSLHLFKHSHTHTSTIRTF